MRITQQFKFLTAALLALTGIAFAALAAHSPAISSAACAESSGGGLSIPSSDCTPTKRAKLVRGIAVAPTTAPPEVKAVIKAANKIRLKPYIYGGGHGKWKDKGYDCSGSVSYALHGGDLLSSPMPSGSFVKWQKPGVGRWISTYANGGHMFMTVAGLLFDTSAMSSNKGNRWSKSMRDTSGFKVRHPAGF